MHKNDQKWKQNVLYVKQKRAHHKHAHCYVSHFLHRFIIWLKKRLGLAQLVLRNGFHDLKWPASQYQARNQVCTVKNAQWRHRAQSNVWGKNGSDGEESCRCIFSKSKTLNPLITDWQADTEVKASHQFLIQVIFKRKVSKFFLNFFFW